MLCKNFFVEGTRKEYCKAGCVAELEGDGMDCCCIEKDGDENCHTEHVGSGRFSFDTNADECKESHKKSTDYGWRGVEIEERSDEACA